MSSTLQENAYFVQCLNGHIHEVVSGSELEQKCQERTASGYLDAFCLSSDECPHCIEDAQARGMKGEMDCGYFGCAMNKPCAVGTCKLNPHIPPSPIRSQVGRFVGFIGE